MRFQSIIVPGWKNSGPDHWQTQWEQKLPHCARVAQPEWDHPEPRVWHGAVAGAVDAASGPVLLIAHSLGCLAVAALPVALHVRVAGALLVAPADVEREDVPNALKAFAPISANSLGFQSVVVASEDDPHCAPARAQHLAQAWSSRLVIACHAGHINVASGHGAWPEGLKLLMALRRRVAWRVQPPPPRVAHLSGSLTARDNRP